MLQKPMKLITGAKVLRASGEVTNETLVIEGEQIVRLTTEAPGAYLLSRDDVEVYSGEGCYLTPGLIDVHTNGGFGCDFNNTSVTEIQSLLSELPKYGVTSIVPTVITAPTMDMLTSITTLEEALHMQRSNQCQLHGLYLEGPFIHPEYRGAHPQIESLGFGENLVSRLNTLLSPNVKVMTLAPELDTTGLLIKALCERGVRVMAGHTNATWEEIQRASFQGLAGITHLFNAMRPLRHREPGVACAALTLPQLYVEVISDGVHLHPETVHLVLRAKEADKILITTDAMALAGLSDGSQCQFGGQTVTRKGTQAVNTEGRLSGSVAMLNDCVKNIVAWGYKSFPEVVPMATTNPARFLGIENKVGSLETGLDANCVLWDMKTLEVKATWVRGNLVYEAGNSSVGNPSKAAPINQAYNSPQLV
ncbi:MAG: N-acetylglucosamine-6-phosphate deacetylase [Cyanobacteria bacterium]|nr:N-acetylglucosamine-6-phosphate deacetylase [Cyanobacteriota bacterium]